MRAAVAGPGLRKDFLVAPQEVEESAAMGADAVLLIADALEDGELREMVATARACRVAALVEAHTQAHAERALQAGAELVGLNNRDLATLRTDVTTALRTITDRAPDALVVLVGYPRLVDPTRSCPALDLSPARLRQAARGLPIRPPACGRARACAPLPACCGACVD